MVEAFNMTFGNDERDVEAWGRMCVLVDMENIPQGLKARRLVNTTMFHFLSYRCRFELHSQITYGPLVKGQEFAESGLDFFRGMEADQR